MRTRSRSTEELSITDRYYVKQSPTYQPIYSAYYTAKWQELIDVITDEPVRYWLGHGNTGTQAFKACSHLTRSATFVNSGMSYYYGGPLNGTAYDVRPSHVICASTGNTSIDVSAFLLQYGLAKVPNVNPTYGHYDRWQTRGRPTMATRANLAVFLAELRDIRRMFELLPAKHFRITDLYGTTSKWRKDHVVRSWKELLRYANNQHLSFNFGWKPFLRDIYKFLRAKESFDDRLRRYVNNQMRFIRRKVRDTVETTILEGSVPYGSWYMDWRTTYEVNYASTFQYLYRLPEYSERELYWRAWADSLGANVTIQNVWALVPWSFVWDWYVDVGTFLGTLSNDWIEPWVQFIQACSSCHVVGDTSLTIRGPSSWGTPTSVLALERFESYTRKVGTPNFTWDTEALDADKIRLLASLALSRLI